jgi:hypothetical protein
VRRWRGGGEWIEHYRSTLDAAPRQLERFMDGASWKLSHCRLDDFQMSSITSLLVANPQLTAVDLSGNSLQDRSVALLVEQLPASTPAAAGEEEPEPAPQVAPPGAASGGAAAEGGGADGMGEQEVD